MLDTIRQALEAERDHSKITPTMLRDLNIVRDRLTTLSLVFSRHLNGSRPSLSRHSYAEGLMPVLAKGGPFTDTPFRSANELRDFNPYWRRLMLDLGHVGTDHWRAASSALESLGISYGVTGGQFIFTYLPKETKQKNN